MQMSPNIGQADSPSVNALPPAPPTRKWRYLAFAAALCACGYMALGVNWNTTFSMLGRIGVVWPVLLLPFFLGMALATQAWRATLACLQRPTSFLPLLRLRLMAEAILLALPGGGLFVEGIKPFWIHRRMGVPLPQGAASVAIVKGYTAQAEGVYVLLAFVLAHSSWMAIMTRSHSGTASVWLLLPGLGVVLFVGGTALLQAMRGAAVVKWLHSALARLPVRRLRRWATEREQGFALAGASFLEFFTPINRRARALVFLLCLGHWLTEALETFLILHFLHVSLSFSDAFLIEALLSTLRVAAFFLPGGLGAVELGALVLLSHFGVANPTETTAALVFAKRTREVFLIVISVTLALVRRSFASTLRPLKLDHPHSAPAAICDNQRQLRARFARGSLNQPQMPDIAKPLGAP